MWAETLEVKNEARQMTFRHRQSFRIWSSCLAKRALDRQLLTITAFEIKIEPKRSTFDHNTRRPTTILSKAVFKKLTSFDLWQSWNLFIDSLIRYSGLWVQHPMKNASNRSLGIDPTWPSASGGILKGSTPGGKLTVLAHYPFIILRFFCTQYPKVARGGLGGKGNESFKTHTYMASDMKRKERVNDHNTVIGWFIILFNRNDCWKWCCFVDRCVMMAKSWA